MGSGQGTTIEKSCVKVNITTKPPSFRNVGFAAKTQMHDSDDSNTRAAVLLVLPLQSVRTYDRTVRDFDTRLRAKFELDRKSINSCWFSMFRSGWRDYIVEFDVRNADRQKQEAL